jgi:hypothetical protein
VIPDPVGWFAAGLCTAFLGQWLGMLLLSRRQGHLRRAAAALPMFIEGRVQRGNGNGGPSTAKPPIKPQPHGRRMIRTTCSRCPQPHDNWPGDDGGLLCQECWEAESSASWWATMRALDEAGLLVQEGGEGDVQP